MSMLRFLPSNIKISRFFINRAFIQPLLQLLHNPFPTLNPTSFFLAGCIFASNIIQYIHFKKLNS